MAESRFASEDPDALRAEVERLRAENAKLSSAASPTEFWRNTGGGVLIVIGVLVLSMAIAAVWLNRTVMDEDRWVETVAPLAQDAAIQEYVASSASNAIVEGIDIQSYVQEALSALPPKAEILAAPITAAIQTFVRDSASKFVQSPQFPEAWTEMNRLAHRAFIASITQTQGQLINNQNGKVTLDVSVLTDRIKQALSDKGLKFVNDIPLAPSKKQIVLYDSPTLAQFGVIIHAMNTAAYLLPLLALALLGGGVALAANRRKAVLWLGIGIVVATTLPVEMIYLGQAPFAKAAYSLGQMPSAAAEHAYTIVFRNLIRADWIAAFLGAVLAFGAMAVGPAAWAVALRRGVANGQLLGGVGLGWGFGPTGEWIPPHSLRRSTSQVPTRRRRD